MQLFFVAVGFILTGMAMALFVYRDSRPRRDEWQTIVRRADQPPPSERPHPRGYCDRKERDDVGLGPTS